MATYPATGIVIARTNYGEADRIIRIMTQQQGKLSTIAKGVRRIKSKSGGHLELFGEVSLMLAEGKNLDVVASAKLAWYPHNLTGDYASIGHAYMFASMLDRLLEDRQPQPELYDVLSEALHALDREGSTPLLELWYKLRLLSALGYRPDLAQCMVCGENTPGAAYYFSAERGGIVDESCRGAADRPISADTIKLWRLLLDSPYATMARITGAQPLAQASIVSCDEFYEFHLGRSFHPDITGA